MRNSRRGAVDPFIVMDVMEAARSEEAKGRHIVHMEVGQPGTPAPEAARAALVLAMRDGPLGYTVALGLPALRARIARYYSDCHGLDVPAGRIVVTSGSSAGFILAFTALFDSGARVALAEPGYPSYRNILKSLDIEAVGLATNVADGYQPTPDALAAAGPLDGLLVASPANPTGSMLAPDALRALVVAARERGLSFISDEIYHGIHYGEPATTALAFGDDVVVINSFSKFFSMTGWRVGWMVVPEGLIRQVERLAQNLFICPPHASQVAALAAMDAKAELEANVAVYARNRGLMIEGLAQAGIARIAPPDGAFYIYADMNNVTADSREFGHRLLVEAGVAVTPGLDFDPRRGAGTMRFSYARETAEIIEGLARIRAFMGR